MHACTYAHTSPALLQTWRGQRIVVLASDVAELGGLEADLQSCVTSAATEAQTAVSTVGKKGGKKKADNKRNKRVQKGVVASGAGTNHWRRGLGRMRNVWFHADLEEAKPAALSTSELLMAANEVERDTFKTICWFGYDGLLLCRNRQNSIDQEPTQYIVSRTKIGTRSLLGKLWQLLVDSEQAPPHALAEWPLLLTTEGPQPCRTITCLDEACVP